MSGLFIDEGNVGEEPSIRSLTDAEGKQQSVLNMSVRFNRRVPNGQGGYEDKGGFWMDVSYWGKRAEILAKILKKGARISVRGEQFSDSWADKETGEPRQKMKVRADYIAIDPICIDAINFKKRNQEGHQSGSVVETADESYATDTQS